MASPEKTFSELITAINEQKSISPSSIVHQFTEWWDMFDKFIKDHGITLNIDAKDPILSAFDYNFGNKVSKLGKLKLSKIKSIQNELRNKISEKYDTNVESLNIPKQYLSHLIEQYIFKTVANTYPMQYLSSLQTKSQSYAWNFYLARVVFSVLDWKENYRIVYDENKYYQSIFDEIGNKSVLSRDILNIIHKLLCSIYCGIVSTCQGYIVIPKYHPWAKIYRNDSSAIPLRVHGGLTWLRGEVPKQIQNKTNLCLNDGICIGWDYYHSNPDTKPGYDYGIKLTFDLVKNEVLSAIQFAKKHSDDN
eukprot:512882_1